jgi:hypothetical protein
LSEGGVCSTHRNLPEALNDEHDAVVRLDTSRVGPSLDLGGEEVVRLQALVLMTRTKHRGFVD